jgi:Tfp pilus assembly PilM family ATPase
VKKVIKKKVQVPEDFDMKELDDEFVEKFVNKFVDEYVEKKFGTSDVEESNAVLFSLQKDLEHVKIRSLNKNKTSYSLEELETACNSLLDEIRPEFNNYKFKSKIYFISTVLLIIAILIKLFIIK